MKKVIVIGGGHAGIEAASASAKMGVPTMLITSRIETIGLTPCNPSIGGPAKGNVVVEIDALGGLMGKISDQSMIQIKKLNRSKGPAVQAIRAQIDKDKYQKNAQEMLKSVDGLEIVEDFVEDIVIENGEIVGVKTPKDFYEADQVVLTTGTYMDSYIIKGQEKVASGPDNLPTSRVLSDNLRDQGLEFFRLKTGTPARVKKSSVDFSKAQVAPGDNESISFSHFDKPNFDYANQVDCYLIYTQPETHEIIKRNFHLSAMDTGLIEGVGARYCPSIEDKLKRFSDKERHQLFLEPEGIDSESIYVQGFSTSMPDDVQLEMLQSLPGLENVEVLKYGYAIEYDALYPEQLKRTLESKKIKGLYTAGQINGTSGYEEAAGQGIIAGINAALAFQEKAPFILTRAESYIGLMIDDLVTKGTKEPYRLLTSRSEYRLYLRNDNADTRLLEKAYAVGMIEEEVFEKFVEKKLLINEMLEFSENTIVSPKIITKDVAVKLDTEELSHGYKLSEFVKRPSVRLVDLAEYIQLPTIDPEILNIVEIEYKYAGYIKKIEQEIEGFLRQENREIPLDIDYQEIVHLALEAREKLQQIRPETIGQASRISGINPSDISVLLLYLKQQKSILN